MDVVSGAVTLRDVNGKSLATSTADAFWSAAGVGGTPAAFAQHSMFDASSQRWYVTAEQKTAGTPNQIYVAISKTGDVTSPWKAIALPPQAAMVTKTHLAVDPAGIYITGEMAGHSIVMALPIEDLLWTGTASPSAAHLNVFTVPRSGLVPAIDPDGAIVSWSRMFIARDVLPSGNAAIDVYRLNWDGSVPGSQLQATLGAPAVVDLGIAYPLPNRAAEQPPPAPRLDAGNGDIASASSDGYHLVGVATTEQAGYLATLWFEIAVDPSTPSISPAVEQQGIISDAADLIVPAIAIDGANAIGIVVVRVSASAPPAVCVTGQGNGDVPGTMRALVPASGGDAPYSCDPVNGVSPFGRYSSIASTVTGFWAVAQYGASSTSCAFGTAWVNFAVPPSALPIDPTGADGGLGDHPAGSASGCAGCASTGEVAPLAWLVALVGLALFWRRARPHTRRE